MHSKQDLTRQAQSLSFIIMHLMLSALVQGGSP